MRNPFKRETRAAAGGNATDNVVNSILAANAQAAGSALPSATGALEIAAGFVGRAFAAAQVEGGSGIEAALTPSVLQMIGRQLIRAGEFVGLIEVDGGGVEIAPANSWDINGSYQRATWRYALTLASPSGRSPTVRVPAEQVLHIRYATDPATPWKGRSPVAVAALAGRLSAETIKMLADEVSGPRGYLLPVVGADGADDTINEFRGQLAGLNGRVATVEAQQSMAADAGLMRRREWETIRIGGTPPEQNIALAKMASEEVLGACGIPQGLVIGDSVSAGLREAWRVFLFGTLAPLGRLAQEEIGAKLAGVRLDWDDLKASDLQGRARAFQSLVGGGMAVERAAALSGLLAEDAT